MPYSCEPEPEEVKKAWELERDGKKILITHFADETTAICDDTGRCHFTVDRDGKFAYMVQAFYSDLGFKVKSLIP